MSKAATVTIVAPEDGTQAKALQHYEEQRVVWDRIQRNLAKKFNKTDPSETLPGSIHHHRLRTEELGILDVAVPTSVRNGSNAWEMSLRGGAGGVRYVQIGKAYPYPLYCPIRDPDSVGSDSNHLMRMIPMDKVPPRNKPASETEYFHDRQEQFRQFVKKKFSHFTENQEPLMVHGCPPAISEKPIPEDDTVEAVQFIPMGPAASNAHPVTQFMTEEPKSRPLSAITNPNIQDASSAGAPPPPVQSGPMLCFSTSHVSFTTAPGESAQGTVVVDNIGTTAVYYSWAVVPQTSVTGEEKQVDYFHLSDSSSSVLLPEDQKLFSFTVRSPVPGIFTKQYELLTVPAGKERIIVHLRAVVLTSELNSVATTRLDHELHSKALRDYQRQLLTDSIWNPNNFVLDHANIEIELRNLTKAKAKKLAELQGVGEIQEACWQEHNGPLNIPYNQAVYSKIMVLHRNFHAFLDTIQTPPQQHGVLTMSPRTPSKDWDGSVKSLMEDFSRLKDVATRNTFIAALNALLRCGKTSEDRSESLHALIVRSSGRAAWTQAADDIQRYAGIAKDLAEGKSVKAAKDVKPPTDSKAKPPPKAAKPVKGAPVPAATPSEPKNDGSSDIKHPNFDRFFLSGTRRIVGDLIEAIIWNIDNTSEHIAAAADRPFECTVKKRMDAIVDTQHAPDPEIDLAPEIKAKKK